MHTARRTLGIFLWLAVAAIAALWQASPALAGDALEQRGRISQLPPGGGAGTWVVGDMTFTADGSTEFDTTEGPLELNRCAKVKYVVQGGLNLALEIDSEPAGDCDGGNNGGDPGDDDGDDDGDDNEIEVYGVIKARPATPEVLGAWQISTTTAILTFSADGDTEFEEEHGALDLDICVEVEARHATPTVAEKIESEPAYKCDGRDDDNDGRTEFRGKAYGTVTDNAGGGEGDWTIGGTVYRVTAQTELQGRNGPIINGTYVKVHFRQEGGVRTALKIQAKFDSDDDDDDSGNHGAHDGQAYGLIDEFPPAPHAGLWVVGGVSYTATAQTEFEQEHRPFDVGVRVKVEYYRDAQGQLIAEEIKTTDDNGGVGDGSHFKITGYVTGKPGTGFIGAWSISGEPFTATPGTKFNEDHGLLVKDAFVEVEYRIVNNQRVMHEIETQVAPNAGDDNALGAIQQIGGAMAAAATTTWRIGGVDYTVTAATDLNERGGPLTVGSSALVNSYQAADGTHVATRIQGITIVSRVLLPLTTR